MLRDEFLTKFRNDRKIEPVELPDGSIIHVRELPSRFKTALEFDIHKDADGVLRSLRERLVVLCACSPDGAPLFDDKDTAAISEMPPRILDPIVNAARKLNGFGEAASPEETRKN